MRHHTGHSDEHHGIDLAPMLDFVLNLLIFFIITTSFIKDSGGPSVKLPPALSAEQREQGNILVGVKQNGDVWIDRHQVDIRDLRLLIERMHVERPEDTVVIVADAQSPAGVVAKVMDEVRVGGIKDVAIGASTDLGS